MKKEQKRPSSYPSIAWRVIVLALALWLCCMSIITSAVAQDMYRQIEGKTKQYLSAMTPELYYHEDYPKSLPGSLECGMLHRLHYPYMFLNLEQLWPFVLPQCPDGYSTDDWFWEKWDLLYGFEAAVIYYDENGEILQKSGSYLHFAYQTSDMWNTGQEDMAGFAYIDLNSNHELTAVAEQHLGTQPLGDISTLTFFPLIRLTGYFEGNQFHPVTMDRVNHYDMPGSLSKGTTYGDLDWQGKLKWENFYTQSTDTNQELVTIYGQDVHGCRLLPDEPFSVNGTQFNSLTELLHADKISDQRYSKESLTERILIYRVGSSTQYGEFITAIAVRCWPLQYAMVRLIPAYFISFAVTALVVFLILRKIRKSLTAPLKLLEGRMESHSPIIPDASWKEPYALQTYYQSILEDLHQTKTELTRLHTALDYAHHAEENRRQLISGITHELKTPLAVIHSYAEGLLAGIAGEKKDQYLSIILEETEKMDGMVLQMLDLSRLEAGKVRLSSDQFSLLQLTQTVVEKLTPIAQAKGLTFRYTLMQDFTITGDENRIEQVITNLVSNAVKYALPDSEIRLKLYAYQKEARFYIENASPHLSEEALEKVWDSFYRTDPSRSETGTGLGLALVKRIVALHQGRCSVVNTTYTTEESVQPCVEFGFTLPIS